VPARIHHVFSQAAHPEASQAGRRRGAWGVVSYTYEDDNFRKYTTDDCIGFKLFVKPETFARYATKVAHGPVDNMILGVRGVDGFYSVWSNYSNSTS
jgi:hypothetical protein